MKKVPGVFLLDGVSRTVGVNTYSLSTRIILNGEDTGAGFSARMEALEDAVHVME